MSYLEQLAKAVLEGRVTIDVRKSNGGNVQAYEINVAPDPEQEAIESIKKGKVT